MKWRKLRSSRNIEDRRGRRVSGGPKLLGGGLGSIVVVLVALYFGVDPALIGTLLGDEQPAAHGSPASAPGLGSDEKTRFIAAVLGDTEQTWGSIFAAGGRRYEEPKLVLFSTSVNSACGFAKSAMGPFYCPGDRKVYLDLTFLEDLGARYGAPGDFAQAYVIAHEVGHHVQTLLGISTQVQQAGRGRSSAEVNALSVKQELQADCFAGVWAHSAALRDVLEAGDLEEGLGAASAVGDDRLQQRGQGYVVPESFTHGTSAQRMNWFRRGFESGSLESCDSFS